MTPDHHDGEVDLDQRPMAVQHTTVSSVASFDASYPPIPGNCSSPNVDTYANDFWYDYEGQDLDEEFEGFQFNLDILPPSIQQPLSQQSKGSPRSSGSSPKIDFCCESSWLRNTNEAPRSQATMRGAATGTKNSEEDATDDNLVSQMAKEMSELSIEERNTMHEEIHGIVNMESENSDLVEEKLQELDIELDLLLCACANPNERYGYDRSLQIDPSYATSKAFRLMFLRGCSMDVEYTAKRILTHFQWKLRLFGDNEILGRNVRLSDLSHDDMHVLQTGAVLFLPGTDMAGRKVTMFVEKLIDAKEWENQLRVMFYQVFAALWNDETAQRRGIVFVGYAVHDRHGQEYLGGHRQNKKKRHHQFINEFISLPKFREAAPDRPTALHYCYNSTVMHTILQIQQKISTKEFRLRFQTHYGSHVECQYKLMSFGIHPSMLSVDEEGNLRNYMVNNYIETQRMKEDGTPSIVSYYPTNSSRRTSSTTSTRTTASSTTSRGSSNCNDECLTTVAEETLAVTNDKVATRDRGPSIRSAQSSVSVIQQTVPHKDVHDYDVLLGRGRFCQFNAGNLHLAKIIQQNSDRHRKMGTKVEKKEICWTIVKLIQQEYGGRFLERVSSSSSASSSTRNTTLAKNEDYDMFWKEVPDDVARNKVAYGFRSLVKMQKKTENRKRCID